MAAERTQNLQDTFLNYVRKNKVPLTIFLVNGVKLQGVVTWFDNFCVLLRRDGHSQLVYKHAISTVMPGQPIQMFESPEDVPAAAAPPPRPSSDRGEGRPSSLRGCRRSGASVQVRQQPRPWRSQRVGSRLTPAAGIGRAVRTRD